MKHRSGNNQNKITGYLIAVAASLVAGFVFWILGEFLFSPLAEKMFTPVGMMLYFLVFFIDIAGCSIVFNLIRNGTKWTGTKLKNSGKLLLVLLCVFCIVTGVFEFLYELGDSAIPDATSYIFLIDDSGSMRGTERERTDALNEVMKDSSLPFSVYKFNSQAVMLRQMSPYTHVIGSDQLGFESDGGTAIIGALNTVVNDFASGKLTGAGNYPKILLLSDGSSSSRGLSGVIKRCRSLQITISSIGVEGCNASLLKKIANKTGGGFVYCNDVSDLANGMSQALVVGSNRNLLSERFVYAKDALYAIMRIVFLSLMGILWSLLKSILADCDESLFGRFFVISCACCCLGAVIVEFGAAEQTISFLRQIFVLLWSILPLKKHIVTEAPPKSVKPVQVVAPPLPQLDQAEMKINHTQGGSILSGDAMRLGGNFPPKNSGNAEQKTKNGPPQFK